MAKPDYALRDPKGWCGDIKRGAALGRSTVYGDPLYAGKMTLVRIHLDAGGYDTNGTYFGSGDPLYWYASNDEGRSIEGMLRALSRTDAKKQVRELYPHARFYR